MKLQVSISPFDYPEEEYEKLPEMNFSADNPDYWLLLPLFEAIEERTGKLIDLGESNSFSGQELEQMELAINKAKTKLDEEEPNEEMILEQDNDRLAILLDQLGRMVSIALAYRQTILATSRQ
ncbi:hypothetical protein GC194_01925 [bacterium]|nr:hypothetical protein [bacterium]